MRAESNLSRTGESYPRWWRRCAWCATVTAGVVAVRDSELTPLVELVASLAVIGGVLAARHEPRTPAAGHDVARGALIATIVALVAVGVSHHLVVGLVTALVLAVTAPRLWRWFQVRWVRVR